MSPQAVPLNDAATASLGLCDNDCGRPAVSGFGRGLYKHCSRACERANVTTFDRETVRQLRQESEAAMAVAARDSAKDVAALEAAEAERVGKARVRVARVPVVTPAQKPAPAPVAAPIQVATVVAAEPKPEPVREPPKPKEPKPQKERALVPFEIDPTISPRKCRRIGCKYPDDKVVRGLCYHDGKTAKTRGIFESVALPKRIKQVVPAESKGVANTNKQIVAFIEKNPGCTHAECAQGVGLTEHYVESKASELRRKSLIAPLPNRDSVEYGRLYPLGYVFTNDPGTLQAKILDHVRKHPGCTSQELDAAIPGYKAEQTVWSMRRDGLLMKSLPRNHRLFGRIFLPNHNISQCRMRPIPKPRAANRLPPISIGLTLSIIKQAGSIGVPLSMIAEKAGCSKARVSKAVKKLVESGDVVYSEQKRRYLSTSKG